MRASDPSERNFEIFADVVHAGLSLRKAAEKYELSVGRIQQVVGQVRSWYDATTPQWGSDDAHAQVAQGFKLLKGRLNHLYVEAMEAWRASQSYYVSQREQMSKPGSAVTFYKQSLGNTRYLLTAMRIAEANAAATVRQAKVCEKLGAKPAAPATPTIAPPVEPYARMEAVEEEVTAKEEQPVAATSVEETPCVAVPEPSPPSVAEVPEISDPMRPRLAKKLARHEKRKAARERKRSRQLM